MNKYPKRSVTGSSFNARVTIVPRVPENVNERQEEPNISKGGITTIRSSLLLEESMHEKFRELCHRENIVRACWVEAAIILAEENPELMGRIKKLAKELTFSRKEEADDRRRVTMFENRKK
jgi:hypothetical protein